MYENLKDEIRSVVRPNFKSQINGQNLQDVLIDMVDNYPTGSEDVPPILAKTGSWDNAAAWVTDNSASLVTSESLYPVVEGLEGEIQEVKDTYATTASLNELSESIASTFPQYATTESLNLVSSSLNEKIDGAISGSGFATTESLNQLSQSVAQDFANLDIPDVGGLATTSSVNSVSQSVSNLSQSVANEFANLDIPDISGLATTSSVLELSESVSSMSSSFDTRINNITGSGGGTSSYWKSGTKSGSIAQKVVPLPSTETNLSSGINSLALGLGWAEGTCSVAQGFRASATGAFTHAEGEMTIAAGEYSHAEGFNARSRGQSSHAEGNWTSAKGAYSHAEGLYVQATNPYEHAEGYVNATASNQIFSVGAGIAAESPGHDPHDEDVPYGVSVFRKNAISVIYNPTSSKVYVMGVGTYNGTNPQPGVNDIATVISQGPDLSGYATTQSLNNFSSSVSASLNNYETWTFILEDSSSVTKSVLVH